MTAVSQTSVPATYNEPTVMWRMRREDGRRVMAVIDQSADVVRVLWIMNATALGAWHFDDWQAAIEWAERLRGHYWASGWRPDAQGSASSA